MPTEEVTFIVLKDGGSREYKRPDVVEVKDYGVVVTNRQPFQKVVHPWGNIVVFKQEVL